jgi:Zn-dependent metalloprotease
MPDRPPYLCGVIPWHILNRMAEEPDDGVGGGARDTLEQMRELATDRSRTLLAIPAPPPAVPERARRRRLVYDARRCRHLPGRLVITEHNSGHADTEAREAYHGSGATFAFFAHAFGRNSIDGHGMTIESTVHYGTRFENALWNGRQMVYGDGDGRIFHRFTASVDVIAHELTHGVTQFSAALGYTGQTGALNEHLSDAFGIMVKQYVLRQTAHQSDWTIGTELFGPDVNARGVRSMANPGSAYDDQFLGRDPQPSHMRDYVTTADDHGGVHVNSGILNHAFYIAAIVIGGKTWRVLGRIWYVVLTRYLRPEADFYDFVRATVHVAGELYGKGSRIQRILIGAWGDVGLDVPDAPCDHTDRWERRRRSHRKPSMKQRRSIS